MTTSAQDRVRRSREQAAASVRERERAEAAAAQERYAQDLGSQLSMILRNGLAHQVVCKLAIRRGFSDAERQRVFDNLHAVARRQRYVVTSMGTTRIGWKREPYVLIELLRRT